MMMIEGLETQVTLFPYTKSMLGDTHGYVAETSEKVTVMTVKDFEDSLVQVFLPNGGSVIVKAEQMIKAIQKCIKQ